MSDWTPPSMPPGPPHGTGPGSAPPTGPLRPAPPPQGAWDPLPGEPPPPRRRWPAALAVLVVLALVAGVAVVLVGGDDAGETDEAPLSEGDEPGAPTDGDTGDDTGPPPDGREDVVIGNLSSFVEQARDREFLEPVEVVLLEEDEFSRRIRDEFEEDLADEDVQDSRAWLQAFGIVEPGTDLRSTYLQLYGEGVVGFYDPETGELVVRGAEPTPYVRRVLVHELTHALEDQHFDIEREELRRAEDERSFGFLGLTEGSAEYVASQYERSLTSAQQRQLAEEELALGRDLDVSGVPLFLLLSVTAPYQFGPDFVRAIVEAGGLGRLDAAFEAPPSTSEQILEPETYLAGEGGLEVATPGPDGEVVDEGPLGALFFEILFTVDPVDPSTAAAAVDGWGGDAAVVWEEGGRACVRAAIVGDTPADTGELADALQQWAGHHGDAEVAADDGQVELTVCA